MNELFKKREMDGVLEASAHTSTARLLCKGRLLTQNACCTLKPGDTLHLSTSLSQQKLCGGSKKDSDDSYKKAPAG